MFLFQICHSLTQGLANFFGEGQDNKYFGLCEPHLFYFCKTGSAWICSAICSWTTPALTRVLLIRQNLTGQHFQETEINNTFQF